MSKVRRSSWTVTLPVTAVGIAYVTLWFLPQNRAISKIRDEVQEKQQYVVQASYTVDALRQAEAELNETLQYTNTWYNRTPVEGDLSATFGRINALGEEAGATITQFDPEPVVHQETLSLAPLRVGCLGSFGEICGFLEQIERLPFNVWIKELRLQQNRQDGGHVLCELILAIFTSNSGDSDYVEHSL